MRILGHRRLGGANLYHDGPIDYLVVRGDEDPAAAKKRLAEEHEFVSSELGMLVGEIAVELQRRAGAAAQFFDAWADPDGDWIVVTDGTEAETAHAAAREAVRLVEHAAIGNGADMSAAVAAVALAREEWLGPPGIRDILDAAEMRGIPITTRGHEHYQLGWGNQQLHMRGLITKRTSGLGYEIANDNERILQVLEDTGIPIPEGEARRTLRGVEELAEELRFPVAIKPLRGRGGVTRHVGSMDEIEAAYDKAKEHHAWVVVEDAIRGTGHQLLVVDGAVVSAVTDDGDDVTDTIHPSVRLVAERAARHCFLDVAGVDIVASDISIPLDESRGRVVSIHPEPNLSRHRDAAEAILAGWIPEGDARIPLLTVTGTNGKTTTVRLISHILKYAGGRVGLACTGTVEVENEVILRGDYSGPTAARAVLQEPGITHAVCEVARGGILRRGLGFDASDVAVILNVSSDHLGQGGIDTVEQLAEVKAVLLKALRPDGVAVLNADDPLVWAMRDRAARIIPFTMDPDHPDLAAHLAADPENVFVTHHDGAIVVRRGTAEFRVADVLDIPLTLGGAARFHIENAMAAVAATYAVGVSEENTRAGLITFNPSVGQLPGRTNLMDLGGVKVLLDYGHNVAALQALSGLVNRLAKGKRINVANASGNRRDEDLLAFGEQIAAMYDRIFLCDPDPRRRKVGETAAVIEKGIRQAGFADEALTVELDEGRALRQALVEAKPGDLVVLQADDVQGAIDLCQRLQERLQAGESPAALNEELLSQ